jgi:hypothetical protein
MSSQHALTNRGDACLRDVHSTGTSLRASIEMKRHSLTFPCARTRLLLSMQHEKHSERLHPDQSGQATHQAMPLAHPTPWVLACDPLSHACLRHMLTDVTRVAAQSRLNATLSRTCSKPHHLAFRMSLHAPKHRRQNARLACARTRTPLSKQREDPYSNCGTRPNDASAITDALAKIQSCPTSQAATPTHATRLPASRPSPHNPRSDGPPHRP